MIVNDSTVLSGVNSFSDLQVGNIVEISGEANEDGDIVATSLRFISAAFNGRAITLRGIVEELDTTASTFKVRSLTIRFSSNTVTGTLANGAFVRVRGENPPANDEFTATSVRVKSRFEIPDDGTAGRVEGVVSSLDSTRDFTVNFRPVVVNDSTTFVDGVEADIVLGARLVVEGTFNTSAELVATTVTFNTGVPAFMTGNVEAVDTANSDLTLVGTKVAVSQRTRMRDRLRRRFSLDDLNVGNRISVFGTFSNSEVAARKIRRFVSNDTDVVVSSEVGSGNVTTATLSIMGINITTIGTTVFEDINDANVPADGGTSADRFFGLLQAGNTGGNNTVVTATGALLGDGSVQAEKLSIERGPPVVSDRVSLSGDSVVPPVTTFARGRAFARLNTVTGALVGHVHVFGVIGSAARIHEAAAGANGTAIVTLDAGTRSFDVPANTFLTADQITSAQNDGLYISVESQAFPNGQIRGQIEFSGN